MFSSTTKQIYQQALWIMDCFYYTTSKPSPSALQNRLPFVNETLQIVVFKCLTLTAASVIAPQRQGIHKNVCKQFFRMSTASQQIIVMTSSSNSRSLRIRWDFLCFSLVLIVLWCAKESYYYSIILVPNTKLHKWRWDILPSEGEGGKEAVWSRPIIWRGRPMLISKF